MHSSVNSVRQPSPLRDDALVDRQMRFVIGPIEIAGVAAGLAFALNGSGQRATPAVRALHRFRYPVAESPPRMVRQWQQSHEFWTASRSSSLLARAAASAHHRILSWLLLFYLILKNDCFIYLYGQTFTNTRLELVLVRRTRRKIVFINLGSDTRPPYMDGPFLGKNPTADELAEATRSRRKLVRRQEAFADYIIASPACGQFHRTPFINWFALGFPQAPPSGIPDAGLRESTTDARASQTLRILHSPSDEAVKGTAVIVATVDRLIAEGFALELQMIRDVPNEEVIRQLATCDLVIDQVYSDSPMAGVATEAARLGKPTVVSGYFASKAAESIPPQLMPPSLFVHPDGLYDAVRELVSHSERRCRLGEAAQRFVRETWAPASIAGRLLQVLDGNAPPEWWCDPAHFDYVLGCGLHESETRRLIVRLVDKHGIDSLQLNENSNVREAAIHLIRRRSTEA